MQTESSVNEMESSALTVAVTEATASLPSASAAATGASSGGTTPKAILQPPGLRGYPAVPTESQNHNTVRNCTCPRCESLLRDPVQAQCGHRFCGPCSSEIMQRKEMSRRTCPIDEEPITEDTIFKDNYAKKETLNIEVYCSSKRHANRDLNWCHWQGDLRQYLVHEGHCVYVHIACPDCGEEVQRQAMPAHKVSSCSFRLAPCPHCGKEMPWKELQEHQERVCPEVLVSCRNGCTSAPMLRKSIESHDKTCPSFVVKCYYNTTGCDFRGPRQDLKTHHDSSVQFHLQLIEKSCQDVKKRAADYQGSSVAGKVQLMDGTVSELSRVVNEQKAVTQDLSHQLRTVEAERDRLARTVDSMQTGFSSMMARLAALEEQFRTSQSQPQSAGPAASRSEGSDEALTTRVARIDHTVCSHEVQLSDVSMRQDIMEVRSTSGVMVWKISDVKRRMREAANGTTPSLYSPPFYTSLCGYKMCLRIYLNGDGAGRGSHISLFFAIMRGDHDSLLRWPFQQKVSLMLLSQAAMGSEQDGSHVVDSFKPNVGSSSFHRPISDMNVATGCPQFALLQALSEVSRYVRDDSIFIKVVVDGSGMTAPDAPAPVARR